MNLRSRNRKTLVRSSAGEEESNPNGLPPCTFGIPLIDFMNDPEVRTQMHIPEYVQNWTMCKDDYNYTLFENATQSIWDNEDLYSNYRMMKFSGDKDGVVPTYGTLGWINSLNREVTDYWRPWYVNHDGQSSILGGYVQEYKGLTFVSVHGAGHMVPQDQREAALLMVNTFMAGEKMPMRNDTTPTNEEVQFVQI
jgi:serine carboxypeptidase-like clade II